MNKLDHYLQDPQYAKVFVEEGFLNEILEEVAEWMSRTGINRAELARRLSVSAPNITQMLSGQRNLTIRTLANLATVLGGRPRFSIVDLAAGHSAGAENWVPYIASRSRFREWNDPGFSFVGARGEREESQGWCG